MACADGADNKVVARRDALEYRDMARAVGLSRMAIHRICHTFGVAQPVPHQPADVAR